MRRNPYEGTKNLDVPIDKHQPTRPCTPKSLTAGKLWPPGQGLPLQRATAPIEKPRIQGKGSGVARAYAVESAGQNPDNKPPLARAPYRLAPSEMKELRSTTRASDKRLVINHSFITWESSSSISSIPRASKEHEDASKIILELLKKEDCMQIFQVFCIIGDSLKGYQKIAKPMDELTIKRSQFEWVYNKKSKRSSIEAKLCSAPILALPKEVTAYSIHKELNMRQIAGWLELLIWGSTIAIYVIPQEGKKCRCSDALTERTGTHR
ncbi:hypothetical protein Tco_0652316 [Tanacetum coccineum]|uniref:Uncharacterized protein n=1 Tax=Tanacetum coccineum TaxID=301880 RepID=A0ABQ4WXB6_9ASTR